MKRLFASILLAASLCSCTSFTRSVYSNACAKSGYPVGHPQHEECIENTAIADRQEAQSALAVGAAIGGVALGPSQAQQSKSRSYGYLSTNYLSGTNRICVYAGDAGQRTLTVPGGQMCPQQLAY